MKYYEMDHRGGFDEALKTRRPITQTEFNRRLENYNLTCIDENFVWYIIKNKKNGIN